MEYTGNSFNKKKLIQKQQGIIQEKNNNIIVPIKLANEMINNINLDQAIYINHQKNKLKNVLLVCHQEFFFELANVVSRCKGTNIIENLSLQSNTLTILRVYCSTCLSGVCQKQKTCNLEFDYIIINDDSHFNDLNV